ncbi:MAG: ArsR family transcriptional regulator [Bacteroidota bacterium]
MLEALITSKTRMKLLLKFFLNSNASSYLRNLSDEFGESTNSIRVELNRLEKAGLLQVQSSGNKKLFRANIRHPLFPDIQNIMMKHTGLDKVIAEIIENLGDIRKVYVTGDFAGGIDSKIIDLILVGEIDRVYLIKLTAKVEEHINRKIRYAVFGEDEFGEYKLQKNADELFLIWEKNNEKQDEMM